MNIILFGPPGSGKGTQADILVKNFNLFKISAGDILRNEINENSSIGKKIKTTIDKGGFVTDAIVNDLVEKKISLPAYDQCLKASHVFNILDARGVISVAQRAEYISRIRNLTKGVGQIWLESQI